MDSSRDAEVWNYPIVAYNFNFFNPNNGKQSFKLKNAMIPKTDYRNDKFSQYRSPTKEYIVGVEAKIDYQKSKVPEQEDRDSSGKELNSVIYRYDLELDSNGIIIGGEWYTNSNPDFIWFPEDNADPQAPYDSNITTTWNPSKDALPRDWIESANSSAATGKVSSNIIKALFDYSHKGSN
jgi:Transglutaminase elicitor